MVCWAPSQIMGGGALVPLFLRLCVCLFFTVSCRIVLLNQMTLRGWSGGAMVLGKLPVLGRPTVWLLVGKGPNALAVGAGGGCLDFFTLIYPFSPLSPSLWETARYRLKYCLKVPLNTKQPTNQPDDLESWPNHLSF